MLWRHQHLGIGGQPSIIWGKNVLQGSAQTRTPRLPFRIVWLCRDGNYMRFYHMLAGTRSQMFDGPKIGCPVTSWHYFRILFLTSFPVRKIIWTWVGFSKVTELWVFEIRRHMNLKASIIPEKRKKENPSPTLPLIKLQVNVDVMVVNALYIKQSLKQHIEIRLIKNLLSIIGYCLRDKYWILA
jgi:hypothetical protein